MDVRAGIRTRPAPVIRLLTYDMERTAIIKDLLPAVSHMSKLVLPLFIA